MEDLPGNDRRFVGLSNQGATCYMNSVLQSLFMTPEFRTEIYRWQYDKEVHGEPEDCIPLQLQLLFGQLQVSDLPYIDTKGLTRSFGWDVREGFQQHDAQEFVRVLLDAIEQSFNKTPQKDVVNELYQGKLRDYVECCACQSESAREDTFLDISLTVRNPFDNIYNQSVEEALENYLKTEMLDGDNQYEWETWATKTDAKKGLKFTKFPKILMLHLKRFDLDYSTMQRKKLNDRVTFPQVLNMNNFMSPGSILTQGAIPSEYTQREKYESCRSQFSQNQFSQYSQEVEICRGDFEESRDLNILHNSWANPVFDDVEQTPMKIDPYIKSQTKHIHAARRAQELQDQIDHYLESGEFVYELYAIMIHAGSAFGGHYYAYIRSFENDYWYRFNDSNVLDIEESDIETVYGGTTPSWGTNAYGANAYLLMYRKKETNNFKTVPDNEVPRIVHEELERQKALKEKQDQRRKEAMMTIKLKVYYAKQYQEISIRKDKTVYELKDELRQHFEVLEGVDDNDYRLRYYQPHVDDYLDPYDGEHEQKTLQDVGITNIKPLVIEIKSPEEIFDHYTKGDMNVRILPWSDEYDLPTIDKSLPQIIDEHSKRIPIPGDCMMQDFLHKLECRFGIPAERCRLMLKSALTVAYNVTVLNTPINSGKTCRQARITSGQVIYLEESETPADLDNSKWHEFFSADSDRITLTFMNNLVEDPVEEYITVLRSMNMEDLKNRISERIQVLPNQFIMRTGNNMGIEVRDLSKTIAQQAMSRTTKILIFEGIPLSVDQVRISLMQYELKPEHEDYCCTHYQSKEMGIIIMPNTSTVGELKNTIKEQFPEITHPLQNIRLRKLNNHEPDDILQLDKVLSNVDIHRKHEFTLGIFLLPTNGEALPCYRAIIIKRWFPSTWEISSPQEILVDPSESMDTFNSAVSEMFEIPPSQLEIQKIVTPNTFIRGDLQNHATNRWHKLEGWITPLSSSPFFMRFHRDVFLVRDINDIVRDMTEEEKEKYCRKKSTTPEMNTPAERSVKITVKSAKSNEKMILE